jgi:hypothetical protein
MPDTSGPAQLSSVGLPPVTVVKQPTVSDTEGNTVVFDTGSGDNTTAVAASVSVVVILLVLAV